MPESAIIETLAGTGRAQLGYFLPVTRGARALSADAPPSARGPGTAVLDGVRADRWPGLSRGSPALTAWILLAILVVGSGALLYYLARGTTFWFDEWIWILYRRGNDLGTFLRSYNGHFSLIPILIYRFLFATVGIRQYAPYRVVALACHLLCGVLIFVYARQRVGEFLALCAAALVVLLGAGWQDILWAFQMAWLISIAAGTGAMLMLDRRDRKGDVIAAVLMAVSLASSSVGIIFALGVVVEIVWERRWRDGWIFLIPCALYGVWWLAYENSPPLAPLRLLPQFVANAASAAVAGVVGVSAPRPNGAPLSSASLLSVGRPLAIVLIVIVIARLAYLRRVPKRVGCVVAMMLAFWLLTALTRAQLGNGSQAWASRYLYVGGFLIVLLAVELAGEMSIPLPVKAVIGAGVAVALVGGLTNLRNAGYDLRELSQETRADLGALQIGRKTVSPQYASAFIPGSFFIDLRAGPYFAAVKALGTPADSPAQIAASSAYARYLADLELMRIHRVSLDHARTRTILGPRPVASVAGGALSDRGACLTFRRGTGTTQLVVRGPSIDLRLMALKGTATVAVRRFATSFVALGTVSPSRAATLRISSDLAPQPWYVRLIPTAVATVCGLR